VALGLDIKDAGLIGWFEIDEGDRKWESIRQIIFEERLSDSQRAEFTREEILAAEWVIVHAAHVAEYPMPEDDFDAITFDKPSECPACGVGIKQIAPYQMKREPRFGRNHFMLINWTFDIFARIDVFDCLKEEGIRGFEPVDVVWYKKDSILRTVKQLYIGEKVPGCFDEKSLILNGGECGHKRYAYLKAGRPSLIKEKMRQSQDIFQSSEWFGDGHHARHFVLASKRFVGLYLEKGWRGLTFVPGEMT